MNPLAVIVGFLAIQRWYCKEGFTGGYAFGQIQRIHVPSRRLVSLKALPHLPEQCVSSLDFNKIGAESKLRLVTLAASGDLPANSTGIVAILVGLPLGSDAGCHGANTSRIGEVTIVLAREGASIRYAMDLGSAW